MFSKLASENPARPKDDPSEAAARKIGLLLQLLRDDYINVVAYLGQHGKNERTFQRDLRQLRTLGEHLGFSISQIKDGQVRLIGFDRRPRRLPDERPALLRLLAEFGRSLGPPVQEQLGPIADSQQASDSFLRIQTPGLVAGSRVSAVYGALLDAATSPGGRCYVRFSYLNARGTLSERTAEPHHVVVRSGRYYLVAYDVGRRDWRTFALDAIDGIPVKAGTVQSTRTVPAKYLSDDVLGFIKDDSPRVDVTIELNANVAASVTSRSWQQDQRIENLADGRARITVWVSNIAEAVRWAFGFAPDATVVAPPQAVALARSLAEQLAAAAATPEPLEG